MKIKFKKKNQENSNFPQKFIDSLFNSFKQYKKPVFMVICVLGILITSYFTYFRNYTEPKFPVLDEGFYIPAAQKYIDNVMYMQNNPPLGKMIIALGERLVNPNKNIDKHDLLNDEVIGTLDNYSYAGVRLFPVLFATLSSLLLFLIFYLLSRHYVLSALFTSLYLFENASIAHYRAAMIDGTLLFFILGTILYFVYLIQRKKDISSWNYFLLGSLSGLPIAVKSNGAIVLLLFVFLFIYDKKIGVESIKFNLAFVKDSLTKFRSFGMAVLLVYLSVMYIHVAFGRNVVNNDADYYKNYASEGYKEILKKGDTANLFKFPLMLMDNLSYMKNYQERMPKIDKDRSSYPFEWATGARGFFYLHWNDNEKIQEIFLVGNPIIWFIGFVSVILSIALIIAKIVFQLKDPPENLENIEEKQRLFNYIIVFTALYLCYMIAMSQIGRVLYLYHYLVPLVFSFILALLVFKYIFIDYIKKHDKVLCMSVILTIAVIIYTYNFFSPLTYYKALSNNDFLQRAWFSQWGLLKYDE
ncbi:MAG: phospholipid carrier-dependent glycosyltransferase [bacterium]